MAETTYIVKSGDSLSAISKIFFGDFSKTDAIARLNNISHTNVIQPGQKLLIPGVEEAQVVETTVQKKHDATYYIDWGIRIFTVLTIVGFVVHAVKKKKKKSSLNGKKDKTIIGKTKLGKAVYVNKTADAYENFTKQDHLDAADIHYKHYHKKNADGSTVLHGKRSMESHLKAADK